MERLLQARVLEYLSSRRGSLAAPSDEMDVAMDVLRTAFGMTSDAEVASLTSTGPTLLQAFTAGSPSSPVTAAPESA